MYKEKKRWKELYKFLSIDNKIVIILINNSAINAIDILLQTMASELKLINLPSMPVKPHMTIIICKRIRLLFFDRFMMIFLQVHNST